MNETDRFERWLGQHLPFTRAHVFTSPPGPVQRLTVSFLDEPVCIAIGVRIVDGAWDEGGWLLERSDWRLRANGALEVRAMEFVRGAP